MDLTSPCSDLPQCELIAFAVMKCFANLLRVVLELCCVIGRFE